MLATIGISIVSILGMFACLIFCPSLKIGRVKLQTFYMAPLLGAIIILCFHLVDYASLWESLTSSSGINPLQILVLFLSMSILSLVLDQAGFFSFLAHKVAQKAKDSQILLFSLLYLLCSLLTIFTSNDIVILTFTPFIIFFSKEGHIDPKPYLISEFVAANSWSMLLLIGNPTNIYLGASFNIDFFSYFKVMWLPAVLSGVAGYMMMLLLCKKPLSQPFIASEENVVLKDPLMSWISLGILSVTIILLAVSSLVSFPMWLISFFGAVAVLICQLIIDIVRKDHLIPLARIMKRPPYAVVPFILSMFILVISLKQAGVTLSIADALDSINPYLGYGLTSFIGANLLNNIPMSVFFTEIISSSSSASLLPVYLSIISSNIGAFLTPIGALAGFMWEGILAEHEEKMPISEFLKYLSPVSLVSLGFAFLGLFIVF